jgi:hypothetical protein
VVRNRVTGNATVGIIVTALAGYTPGADTIRGDVTTANGADLVYDPGTGRVASAGNCFAANDFATSVPRSIETLLTCGSPSHAIADGAFRARSGPAGSNYETLPAPPAQPGMADPTTTPADPALTEPPPLDLGSVALPAS